MPMNKSNLGSPLLDYRTVTGVNGPLVILDNVKVCILLILYYFYQVAKENKWELYYYCRHGEGGGDDASRRRRFDTLREIPHTYFVSDIDL